MGAWRCRTGRFPLHIKLEMRFFEGAGLLKKELMSVPGSTLNLEPSWMPTGKKLPPLCVCCLSDFTSIP